MTTSGTDGGAGGSTGTAAALPCDVEQVLRARCQGCHRQPPQFGAPMPLLTYADTQATRPGGTKVSQLMKTLVSMNAMPPSATPTGPLTTAERATLLNWLDAGTPAGAGNCVTPYGMDGGAPPAPAAMDLPCAPSHEFRAFGAAAGTPFPVPVANDHYQCFNFQSPFTEPEQAIAWAPIIDDTRVVHHWILYAQQGTFPGPSGCDHNTRTFLMGWAPGGGVATLPADVGLELPNPSGSWLSLEVHYNNKAQIRDARDRSGVAICTTKAPRAKEAGILTLGNRRLVIPPGATGHPVTGECAPTATALLAEPLHVLGSGPHMHQLGVSFKTEIERAGQVTTLVDVPRWDFASQQFYWNDPEKMLIRPGDSVRTTCVYNNPTNQTIRFGERTQDEMCLNFVMVYPISAVPVRACL